MQAIYYLLSVGTGRPVDYGRTSGWGISTIKIIFGPHLQISVWMSNSIPFLDYMLLCLYDYYLSRFWCFQSFQNIWFCIFENFLIYTWDPNLKPFSIMPFETLKWFWKFWLKNIFKTSHILFNILCASFMFENYICQKIFQKGY